MGKYHTHWVKRVRYEIIIIHISGYPCTHLIFWDVALYNILVELVTMLKVYCNAYFVALWMVKLPLYIVVSLWINHVWLCAIVYDHVLVFLFCVVVMAKYGFCMRICCVYNMMMLYISMCCSLYCLVVLNFVYMFYGYFS
jgi:hypothetical protein